MNCVLQYFAKFNFVRLRSYFVKQCDFKKFFALAFLFLGAVPAQDEKPPNFVSAVIEGRLERIKDFIRDGHDPDWRNLDGSTALNKAAQLGRLDIVDVLLKAGADPGLEDNWGRTPLTWAIKRGDFRMFQALVAAMPHEGELPLNPREVLAFHKAVEQGRLWFVQDMLDAGVSPDIKDGKGNTPLMRAAGEGNIPMVQALVDAGADVNLSNKYGVTALIQAVSAGNLEVFQMLRDNGAELKRQYRDGYIFFLLAARKGNNRAINQILADAGFDLKLKDKRGFAALVKAAMENEDSKIDRYVIESYGYGFRKGFFRRIFRSFRAFF